MPNPRTRRDTSASGCDLTRVAERFGQMPNGEGDGLLDRCSFIEQSRPCGANEHGFGKHLKPLESRIQPHPARTCCQSFCHRIVPYKTQNRAKCFKFFSKTYHFYQALPSVRFRDNSVQKASTGKDGCPELLPWMEVPVDFPEAVTGYVGVDFRGTDAGVAQ